MIEPQFLVPLRTTHQSASRRGVALVLVLFLTVIITVLALATLQSVGTFTQASKAVANNSATRTLSEDVVQMIVAQIRDATTLDQTKSWSSQPGMIRTYDTHGNQSLLYKLYSSPNMVVDGSQYQGSSMAKLLTDEEPDGNWDQDPAYYTDLNSPVTASDGQTLVFPIIDPRAWSGQPNPPPIPGGAWNPGAWSSAQGTTDVQGFTYKKTQADGTVVDNVSLPTGTDDNSARLPMPGRWLYIRKDGFITAPTGPPSAGGSVTVPQDPSFQDPVANDSNPNPNPIVGRIAFWTDDDTNKININTACGDLWSPETFPSNFQASPQWKYSPYLHTPGAFWVVPHFSSWFDEWVLAQPPVRNEFQRYAGHPSTVYLSAVFPEFSAVDGSATSGGPSIRDQLFSLIPRVNGGTANVGANAPNQNSEGGTEIVNLTQNASVNGQSTYVADPKHDRLYASADELLYSAQRTLNNNSVFTQGTLEKALQKAKFFITADSKAPEVNLFNLPRISMWPINSNFNINYIAHTTTAYDQLIGYCCSLGTNNNNYYFFERQQATSATTDWGAGRNPKLYSYLQSLLQQPVPGYGGVLGQKYGASGTDGAGNSILESDQILTEIMDYIRCINLQDPFLITQNQFAPPNAPYVVPLQPAVNNTMGFGRYATLGEVGLQFIAVSPPTTMSPEMVVAVILPKVVGVSGGFPFGNIENSTFHLQMSGLSGAFSVNDGTSITTPSFPYQGTYAASQVGFGPGFNVDGPMYSNTTGNTTGTYAYDTQTNTSWGDRQGGIVGAISGSAAAQGVPPTQLIPMSYNPDHYPWVSTPFSFGKPSTSNSTGIPPTFTLSSFGPVTIQISNGAAAVQKFRISFSKLGIGPWQSPSYPPTATPPQTQIPPGAVGEIHGPFNPNATDQKGFVTGKETTFTDALKTIVPGYPQLKTGDVHAGGDYRLVAGARNPPASFWVAEGGGDPQDPGYAANGMPPPLAHNFAVPLFANSQYNSYYPGYDYGSLIDMPPVGINFTWGSFGGIYDYSLDYIPHAPPSYATLHVPWKTELTHDFDQGGGPFTDGPLINHPEEVNLAGLDLPDRNSSQPPYFGNNGYNSPNSGGGNSAANNPTMAEYTSPNRLVPSPGILGSLPTGIAESMSPTGGNSSKPWQTLLFRPQPEHPSAAVGIGGAGTVNTPPFTVDPDHLFLDLFWMPVVEPYAISDTFSTSGKINMNYQIMPYTYIDRATAMQAVLRTVRMAALPTVYYGFHKQQRPEANMTGSSTDPMIDFRYDLNLNTTNGGTLMQFENKFDQGDLFRSASQICDIFMVPLPTAWVTTSSGTNWGGSGSNVQGFGNKDDATSVANDAYNWWNKTSVPNHFNIPPPPDGEQLLGFKLTGDNLREEPYTNIYSLLTTKSNSYTVHMRVQSLRQTSKDPTQWNDPATGGTDVVTGEYRGSASVERFLDSANPTLQQTDFTNQVGSSTTLNSFYKYRVTSTKQFAP